MHSDNAKTRDREDAEARDVDKAVENTFPASDPIAVHGKGGQPRPSPDQAPRITREVYEKQCKERPNG